jgi:methylisocitrate lyase
MSAGAMFRQTLARQGLMPILGVIHAYAALLAARAGATCLYLSGAGLANSVYGLPDLALTSLAEVVAQAEKITDACQLPLLVDIDTGFGSVLNVARSIRLLEKAGVAAIHIEDQVFEKRCGHRDGKMLVSQGVMGDRIKAAVDARQSQDFVVMARTDALAIESPQQVLARIDYYQQCGADMLFLEAIPDLSCLAEMAKQISLPILVNSTEFGKTPIHSQAEWQAHGAQMVLYPLTAFRAMAKVALDVYTSILTTGSQVEVLPQLQTRQDLYGILNYEYYEHLLEGEHHA